MKLTPEIKKAIAKAVVDSGNQSTFEDDTGIPQATISRYLKDKISTVNDRNWRILYPKIKEDLLKNLFSHAAEIILQDKGLKLKIDLSEAALKELKEKRRVPTNDEAKKILRKIAIVEPRLAQFILRDEKSQKPTSRQKVEAYIITRRNNTNLNDDLLKKNLSEIRTRLELTQQELANLSGVNRRTISGIENGSRIPTIGQLEDLSTAMGVTSLDLIEGHIENIEPKIKETFINLQTRIEDLPNKLQELLFNAEGLSNDKIDNLINFIKTRYRKNTD